MLLNVWDQWQESGFSVSWTYEHFIQVKVSDICCDPAPACAS